MKKLYYALPVLLISASLFSATIRVQNETENAIEAAVLSKKSDKAYSIKKGKSKFFNTGFYDVAGVSWKANNVKWKAPISIGAVYTEGRFTIKPNGKYEYKKWAGGKKTSGTALRMTLPRPTLRRTTPKIIPHLKPTPSPEPAPKPRVVPQVSPAARKIEPITPMPKEEPPVFKRITIRKKTPEAPQIKALETKTLYEQGMEHKRKKRYKMAIQFFEQAGNSDAYYELAEMYERGLGVPKNAAKADEYGQKAVELEDIEMEQFGKTFDTGI